MTSKKKIGCRKVGLILLWELTAIAIPIFGAVLMANVDFLVDGYQLSSCVLQTSMTKKIQFGYTTVWLDNSTGCSILQSPLSWYKDIQEAQAQSSIYPCGQVLTCWCNWHDYYEYPLISNKLVATCYLDSSIVSYMQNVITFFIIGKVAFWIGMVFVFISSVVLVVFLMKPVANQEENSLLHQQK